MSYLDQMGIMGYPLLACSIITFGIIAERLIFFVRTYSISDKIIQYILRVQDSQIPDDLISILQKHRFGNLFLDLLNSCKVDVQERENLTSLQLMHTQQELSRYLPILRISASISPLLGLLGTILGMIDAFESISQIKGPITPALISDGISKALLTTAAGLFIAIPALLSYSLFQIRIIGLTKQLTQQLNIINQHMKSKSM